MKWINHALITSSLTYCYTNDLLLTSIATFGAYFPDVIDGKIPDKETDKDNYWKWRKKHRGYSHFFIAYLMLYAMTFFIETYWFISLDFDLLIRYIRFFLLGCILHILEDSLCGKVSFWNTKKRYGLKLFEVGSITEYIFVLFILICCIGYNVYSLRT